MASLLLSRDYSQPYKSIELRIEYWKVKYF